jgi:hypothetical protein
LGRKILRTFEIAGRMLEIEKHREDAKERRGDESYVPDFVDLLLRTPLENGKALPHRNLILILMVSLELLPHPNDP